MHNKIIEYVMGEAAKSNVDKRQVGAAIVVHHEDGTFNILAKGYNTDEVHAEEMACESFYNSEYTKPDGSVLTCYVTHPPCPKCATLLAEHGISNTEIVEAFMKFDGDKLRFDLIDPAFMLTCYHEAPNLIPDVSATFNVERLLYRLREWQLNPSDTKMLVRELIAFYGADLSILEEDLAEVLTFGARKYKPNNWRKCTDTGRYLAAAIRHAKAINSNEAVDPESNLSHAAHIATNIMFLFCLGLSNDY